MIIFGVILIVIFAILAGFCFYKLFFSKNQNVDKNDESQKEIDLINDTREPTQAKNETT